MSNLNEPISKLENIKRKKGRPVGYPRSGGRAKGTPNKASTAWSEVLQANLFSIPQEAIKLFFHKDTNNQLKFHILQFLSTYTTPSIKPIEKEESESPEDATTSHLSTHQLLQSVK